MDRLGMTVPVAGETMAELPAVLDELAAAGYTDIWTSEVNATDAFAPRAGTRRLAGRQSDSVELNSLSPDETARAVPRVLDANPDADVVARLFVVTGPDRETPRGLARRMVTAYPNTGVYAEYQRWL